MFREHLVLLSAVGEWLGQRGTYGRGPESEGFVPDAAVSQREEQGTLRWTLSS